MGRPLWTVKVLKYFYKYVRKIAAIVTNFPIIGDIAEKAVFKGDELVCLPKDHVIQIDKSISQEQRVLPSQVVEHFIDKANFHWIMDFCICRESNNCKDYRRDLGCLFLGEAAMGINPKIGASVSKEEALEHLKKCRDAGLVHFVGKVKGDSLWLGVSPENKLLTICNCCPCCCISTLIKEMSPQIAKNYTKLPGVQVTVSDQCVGCGTCTKICFVEAIRVINKRAVINDICRGCGRCVEVCPRKAIELTLTDDQFLQKTIDRLSKKVILT